jgi:hypothetical protein
MRVLPANSASENATELVQAAKLVFGRRGITSKRLYAPKYLTRSILALAVNVFTPESSINPSSWLDPAMVEVQVRPSRQQVPGLALLCHLSPRE